ncbi:phosphatidylethanolamine-binding protein homolog F40A3.3-like [Episyrphus balteatus]|uniref:phosphatidylethanolamine-binding protein homolog F40A3.3-like n=1 Tax=Episyrphus balteatus TaxID=286459 RepID=UPI00248514FC|nr:phosphatidylethanolamine-binding protein homolog F40A3.3-like [Episyrphus balteatus]
MEAAGIVPEIIDVPPIQVLKVTYPSGVTVDNGNDLTPTQVKDQPSVMWDADENALYTLMLVAPDVPEKIKDALHWLVVNIPGNDLSKGQSVMDFAGSGPPLGSGKHRYIFLVFKQSNPIETNVYIKEKEIVGRFKSKVRDLIKEHNLSDLVAGNFYRAEYDDYVPILRASLNLPPNLKL